MKIDRPKLITFACSMYCEKARWALDWHGIAYQEICWPVGLHEILAKRHGATATTVPILLDGDDVIQGSSSIIDWAERRSNERSRILTVAGSRAIEQRADDVIGVHVRRLYFARMLPKYPGWAKPGLFQNMSTSHHAIGNVMWPVAWRVVMRRYDVTPNAAAESRAILDSELDWIGDQLADNRQYLVGDRFSRADLTVASMLGGFACRQELPGFRGVTFPDDLMADAARWQSHPVMRWVAEQYEAHRSPMRLAA